MVLLPLQYEDVARDTNRGHTVAAVAECFQLAKNAGFKVGVRAHRGCCRVSDACCKGSYRGLQLRLLCAYCLSKPYR